MAEANVWAGGDDGREPEIFWCPSCLRNVPENETVLERGQFSTRIRVHTVCKVDVGPGLQGPPPEPRVEMLGIEGTAFRPRTWQETVNGVHPGPAAQLVDVTIVTDPRELGTVVQLGAEQLTALRRAGWAWNTVPDRGLIYFSPEATAGMKFAVPVPGAPATHYVELNGYDQVCGCLIGHDHDPMGRALKPKEQRTILAKGTDLPPVAEPSPLWKDLKRAMDAIEHAPPWRNDPPMAINRSRLEYELCSDLRKSPASGSTSGLMEIARFLLDRGWIPSMERLAR